MALAPCKVLVRSTAFAEALSGDHSVDPEQWVVNMVDENPESPTPVDLIKLNAKVWNVPLRKDILHRVVVWQRACARQGTAKTKGRSEVRGSTRKISPQKGQGAARHSDRRSNIFMRGGDAFPKRPRDFSYSLPKQVQRLGLRVALSAKRHEGNLAVIASSKLNDEPDYVGKTKDLVNVMVAKGWTNKVNMGGGGVLFILHERDEALECAASNLSRWVSILTPAQANVYDILRRRTLVVTREAVTALEDRVLKPIKR